MAELIDGLLRSAYLSLETLISGINAGLRGTDVSQTVVSVITHLHVARMEESADVEQFRVLWWDFFSDLT